MRDLTLSSHICSFQVHGGAVSIRENTLNILTPPQMFNWKIKLGTAIKNVDLVNLVWRLALLIINNLFVKLEEKR